MGDSQVHNPKRAFINYNLSMMESHRPLILAFVFDLFFVSRIESVANIIGAQVTFWEAVEIPPERETLVAALQKAGGSEPRWPDLVLLDLSTPGLPWETWLIELRGVCDLDQTPLVCFGSHVQVDILARARAAGATAALAKSRFTSGMPEILKKYM
jgi:hypothetical protein